jgi:chromosome segregation ATPase
MHQNESPFREKTNAIQELERYLDSLRSSSETNMRRLSQLNASTTSLKAEIDPLSNQVSTLDEVHLAACEKLSADQEEYERCKETFQRLDGELRTSKWTENELKNHIKQAESDVKAARTSVGKAETMVVDNIRKTDLSDFEVSYLQRSIADIKEEIDTINSNLETARNEEKSVSEFYRETSRAVDKADAEISKEMSQKASLESCLVQRRDVLGHIINEIEDSLRKCRETDLELEGLNGDIEKVSDKVHGLVGEVIHRQELQLPAVLKRIEGLSDRKNEMIVERKSTADRTLEIESEIRNIDIEIDKELKEKRKVDRERELVVREIESKRGESLRIISEKDAANIHLSELITDYKKYSSYLRSREAERDSGSDEIENIRLKRISFEKTLGESKSQRDQLGDELQQKEKAESIQVSLISKLDKSIDSLLKKLDNQRRLLDSKSERIREAQLNDKSSELSLSIRGKLEQTEKDITHTLNICTQLERKRDKLATEFVGVSIDLRGNTENLELLRNIVTVRENQKRRMNVEIEKFQASLKKKHKDIDKLRYDLDKMGILLHRFSEQTASMNSFDEFLEKGNRVKKLVLLNEQLEHEIEDLVASVPKLENRRSDIEKMIEVEEKLQSSLREEGLKSVDVREVQ